MASCIAPFLVGCDGKHGQTALSNAVLAPYVRAVFSDGTSFLTVGNNPSPPKNTASIESFDFGTTDGIHGKLVIIDEEGAEFDKFFTRLLKNLDQTTQSIIYVTYGWIGDNGALISSPSISFMMFHCDTEYQGGIVKFEITLVDVLQATFVVKENGTYGKNDTLKNAIKKLAADGPISLNVTFYPNDWTFADDIMPNPDGFKGNNLNKIATIQSWYMNRKTSNGFGIIMRSDPLTGNLMLYEISDQTQCIASYIVNAGGVSNVIKFSPTINWIAPLYLNSVGGGTSGANSAGVVDANVVADPNSKAGTTKIGGLVGPHVRSDQPLSKNQATTNILNEKLNSEATKLTKPEYASISAELTIPGDPSAIFATPFQLTGKIGIMNICVINPYGITTNNNSTYWTFLSGSSCNTYFTSNKWVVISVSHNIKAGSYTTTFKIMLYNPNSTTSPNVSNTGAENPSSQSDQDPSPANSN